jgi:hypothetical protein
MWERIKWYGMEILLKKYAPVGIAAGMAAIGSYLAAHAGMLEPYGVTYGIWPLHWPAGQDPSGAVILVKLDTLSTAAYTAIVALAAVMIRAGQHHTTGSTVVPGGQRAGDPPNGGAQ